MPCLVSEKRSVEVTCRSMGFCEFICIDGFYLDFDYLQILEEDMPKFMVKIVDVYNILENG